MHTGLIDGGPIYGTDNNVLQNVLRTPNRCELRIAGGREGEFPPITSQSNDNGQFFFLAGDIRLIEHSFLFSQHVVRRPSGSPWLPP